MKYAEFLTRRNSAADKRRERVLSCSSPHSPISAGMKSSDSSTSESPCKTGSGGGGGCGGVGAFDRPDPILTYRLPMRCSCKCLYDVRPSRSNMEIPHR